MKRFFQVMTISAAALGTLGLSGCLPPGRCQFGGTNGIPVLAGPELSQAQPQAAAPNAGVLLALQAGADKAIHTHV